MSQTVQHLLVDFDRTLNDSDRVYENNLDGFLGLTGQQVLEHWEAVHRHVLAKEPREKHEDLEHHYKLMIEQWRMEHDPESLKEELKRRVKAAQEECWYATALFGETFPFLNRLKDEGFTLHVATGDYAQLKKEGIERQGGREYFERVFDESVLGVGKGKRDYFDRALDILGEPPTAALVIGDSLANDVMPAQAVGIAAIWVRRKGEKEREGVTPELTVISLLEALPYLLDPHSVEREQ